MLDDWNDNERDFKEEAVLKSIGYRAEESRFYDPTIGPVDQLHFRHVKGVPIPLPLDHDGAVDNVEIFDVRGLSTLVGCTRPKPKLKK